MSRVVVMNAKIAKNLSIWSPPICTFATQASPKHKVKMETTVLEKQNTKVSTLPSGLVVASTEDYSPVARIAFAVKAGPRYETASNLGISHCIRTCAGLSTTKSTLFGITKNVEFVGGNMFVVTTREHIIYTLECIRDFLDLGSMFLGEIVAQPAFKPWEVNDNLPRMKLDLDVFKINTEAILVEALHKVAFRGGLSNSLYSPDYMVGKHKPAMLHEYVQQNFTTSRMAVVGQGIEHDDLVKFAQAAVASLQSGSGSDSGASKYGGGEVRLEMGLPYVYAAIVAEGASLKNQKDMLSLALLQRVLGTGPHVKYSSGALKLNQAVAKATSSPAAVSTLNYNYSDSGLFGFCVAAQPNEMSKVVKAIVSQMREVGKGISDQELKSAKHSLKAAIHMAQESATCALENLASHILSGQLVESSETEKAIDAITLQDVQAVAAKVTKAKPSMAAVGRLHDTPHLEDLL